ncbi:metal-dependent hydrolase [Azospirillum picis]|uniref:Inner membrane protein n=1 Tax=Azospirillum picis TaxID=488438 RepID=A0ABU0MJN4_9PROT|nr:metal-dependent hydrolase [Azospirillum picis]MBP2299816.1 inner membrane protein [Azospirillum picis]MDQ0533612.1 inner membrane protein [Azospirillum picis]
MASSHIIVGGATWFYLSSRYGVEFDLVAFGAAIVGALAPDIDHPKSTMGQMMRPLSLAVSGIFGHRGITHSVLAIAGCVWLLHEHAAYSRLLVPFIVGYLTHLAGDLLTPAGLPLLWPIKRRRNFALPILKTGGFSEQLAVTLMAGWMISGLFAGGWPEAALNRPWQTVVAAAQTYLGEAGTEKSAPPVPDRKPPDKAKARPLKG